jgi:hypothetical protein
VRALRSHAKERPDAQADALLSYLMQVPTAHSCSPLALSLSLALFLTPL